MTANQLTSEIDAISAEFKKSFGHLTASQLNWNNGGKCWSIAQNMDHIIKINTSYQPIIDKLQNGKLVLPFMANLKFMVNWLGKLILKSVHPARIKKIKTFSIWEPALNDHPEYMLADFIKHQEWLKGIISDNFIYADSIIHSPANKNIVYTLGKAFEIMVTHERRHLNQAKEVLQLFAEKQEAH